MKRSGPPKKRRSGKPRRGRIVDKKRLAWAETQPCCVTGELPATTHHVRFCGSPKDDTRIIRLVARLHMYGSKEKGIPCIEEGKEEFESYHAVVIEEEIMALQIRYENENAAIRRGGSAGF